MTARTSRRLRECGPLRRRVCQIMAMRVDDVHDQIRPRRGGRRESRDAQEASVPPRLDLDLAFRHVRSTTTAKIAEPLLGGRV
jgi:hypothetical protein